MSYFLLALLVAVLIKIAYASTKVAENYSLTPQAVIYGDKDIGRDPDIKLIPKKIWSYWHSDGRPRVASQCLKNWQRLNPDFQINMLHAGNVRDFVSERKLPDDFHKLAHQHQADWLRLALLEQHGGIWLDASIFLTTSLDWMIAEQVKAGSEYVGFDLDDWRLSKTTLPIMENWCMAATKKSRFIHAWLEEFTTALKDGQAYLADLKQQGIYEETIQNIIRPQYFLMHVCAQRVLRKASYSRLSIINAAALAFFYQVQSDWRLERLFYRLLFLRAPERVPALIKLRGRERRKLERFLRYGLYRRSSIVWMYLR